MASKDTKDDSKAPKQGVAAAPMEPRASAFDGWSPKRITEASALCSEGNYSLAADLCESMFSDERVLKSLNRLYAATTLPLTFELPGKDADQSKADPVCQALDYDWWKIFPETVLREMVYWLGSFYGVLAHINGWRRDEETGRVLPVISVWSMRNVRWDDEKGWMVRVRTSASDWFGTEIQIVPGAGSWILIMNGSNYRAPYHAPWRGIATWYLLGKLCSPVDWACSSERHGQGIGVLYNTLSGSSEMADTGEPLSKPEREKTAKELSSIGRNGNIVPPRGWKYEIITDGANTYQTFAKQTDYANTAIDIGFTGTNLTTEVEGGSYSAAKVHQSIDAITMRSLLELLATSLREQVVVWWHRFNFGKGVAPYPKWDTTPPEDKKATAEGRQADAQALKTYRDAGAQLNQKAWFEGRVELLEGASEAFPEKPAAVTAGAVGAESEDDDVTDSQGPAKKPPPSPAKKSSTSFGDAPRAEAREPDDSAFGRGREYIDRLESQCCQHAAAELAPTLASVLIAIRNASNYEELEESLRQAYRDEKPVHELVKLTEQALVMAQLAGRESIDQEAAED